MFCFVFVFSFRQIFGVSLFLGYLGLKGSHISSEKQKQKRKKNIRQGLGWGTCAIFQGLSLKNGVDIWIFVR